MRCHQYIPRVCDLTKDENCPTTHCKEKYKRAKLSMRSHIHSIVVGHFQRILSHLNGIGNFKQVLHYSDLDEQELII